MAITETPSTAADEASIWHTLTREGVVGELGVAPERGLTSEEAADRLARYGPNRFAEAKTEPRWHAFLRQYQDPMQIVLVVVAVSDMGAKVERAMKRAEKLQQKQLEADMSELEADVSEIERSTAGP